MNAQNLQSSVESSGQLELLVKDRNYQIGADRNPDLGLHRVGARAVVMFDSQVAFDPAKALCFRRKNRSVPFCRRFWFSKIDASSGIV
jgi:hypothetical protein